MKENDIKMREDVVEAVVRGVKTDDCMSAQCVGDGKLSGENMENGHNLCSACAEKHGKTAFYSARRALDEMTKKLFPMTEANGRQAFFAAKKAFQAVGLAVIKDPKIAREISNTHELPFLEVLEKVREARKVVWKENARMAAQNSIEKIYPDGGVFDFDKLMAATIEYDGKPVPEFILKQACQNLLSSDKGRMQNWLEEAFGDLKAEIDVEYTEKIDIGDALKKFAEHEFSGKRVSQNMIKKACHDIIEKRRKADEASKKEKYDKLYEGITDTINKMYPFGKFPNLGEILHVGITVDVGDGEVWKASRGQIETCLKQIAEIRLKMAVSKTAKSVKHR